MYLLIVTGLSGAGKTQVLQHLEDMNFFCMDNLPRPLLGSFLSLCTASTKAIDKVAVVIDSRESVFTSEDELALAEIDRIEDVRCEILFLDCSDDELYKRYSQTRRRHPMSGEIGEGIAAERRLLAEYRNRANYVIDTSDMRPLDLKRRIEKLVNGSVSGAFLLTVESFGFKRGIPIEADMVFDMRFIKNPFYEVELRALSGLDEPVREYVMADEKFTAFMDEVERMLDALVPGYIEQGKRRLMVCFGCTGGQHRSVCAAQELYRRMQNKYNAVVSHRDAQLEKQAVQERSSGVKPT